MKVIPYSCQWIEEDDIAAVTTALRQNVIAQGETVDAFEKVLSTITGAKHVVAASNGTAALHIACLALKCSEASIGITSPISFAASANCLLYCNSHVKFQDVDPVTGLMTSSPNTSAANVAIPVSFAGLVPDLPHFQKTFKHVIEDAAHSLGATYAVDDQIFSSASCQHSDMATLSFHPVKTICTGEGGAVLTNNDALAEQLRQLRSHSIVRPEAGPAWFYDQVDLGFNYRMTNIQAALGISQLKKLPRFLERRRYLAQKYTLLLNTRFFQEHISFAPYDHHSAYHLFIIHFQNTDIRDKAQVYLKSKNIETQVHYKPIYQHSYYKQLIPQHTPLPGAEHFHQGCLSIPLYPKLEDDEQDYIVECIEQFLKTL